MCNVWQTVSLFLLFWRQSNIYFSDEWKKSDLNSVPSEPIWGCNMISLTSLKGFLSVHATKNEDLGNLECATCDKRFPYHYSFKDLSNMYLNDEWKQSDMNPVPSEPIWGGNIMSLTSLKGIISVHATKKWRRRKPSWKVLAIWMCEVWQTISLSLLF